MCAMVDVMSTESEIHAKLDVEDGELTEEGEISDDEEPLKTGSNLKTGGSFGSSGSPRKPLSENPWSRPSRASPGQDSDRLAPRGVEDKDYRFEDGGQGGDQDYRDVAPNRRRRFSPPEEDSDLRGAKRGRFGGRGGFRGGRRFNTAHQICKFFREGYCRDGEDCAYSHQAEDSLRRPELCKFYQQGFCKKGLTCLLLHGEYPCRAFHKGECSSEQCRYSHVALTDYTQKIVDRWDDAGANSSGRSSNARGSSSSTAPASYAGGAAAPQSTRRGLLGNGPPAPVHNGPVGVPPGPPGGIPNLPPRVPPTIHAPVPQSGPNGQLAPPSVVVPTLQANNLPLLAGLPMPPGYVPGTPYCPPGAPSPLQPVINSPPPKQDAPKPIFDISKMLAQIAGEATHVSDSPASPTGAPECKEIPWKLFLVEKPIPYSGVDTSKAAANDPRIERVAGAQFDAVSAMIAAATAPAVVPAVRDPRRRPEERKDDIPRPASWMPVMQ